MLPFPPKDKPEGAVESSGDKEWAGALISMTHRPTTNYFYYIYCFSFLLCLPLFVRITDILPEGDLRAFVDEGVRNLLGLDASEPLYTYGGPVLVAIPYNKNRTMLYMLLAGMMFSFVVAYMIIAFCATKIIRRLNESTHINSRTNEMQKRFIRMLICQGFIPLLALGIPVSILLISSLIKAHIGATTTLFASFLFNSHPAFQAAIYLVFLSINKKKAAGYRKAPMGQTPPSKVKAAVEEVYQQQRTATPILTQNGSS